MPRRQKPGVTVNMPDEQKFTCESCGVKTSASDTHSILFGVYHYFVGDDGVFHYSGTQCDNQHYACSKEHAFELAEKCLYDHTPDPTNSTHEVVQVHPVMPTRCALSTCGDKLKSDFYQVAPGYMMRGNSKQPSQAYWAMTNGQQAWFCSMECATEGAEVLLDHLDAMEPEDV